MRTNFTAQQLSDPHLKAAESQLRACVHCGICTATCPTYTLLGDELDGPRGRIQLIQHMLEADTIPSAKVVTHIDRCLSCLACVSACPSGVNYPRLIDQARAHIERKGARTLVQRLFRWTLGAIIPRRTLLRAMLKMGRVVAPMASLLPGKLRVLAQAADKLPAPQQISSVQAQLDTPLLSVALHVGCVQEVIAPQITAAARRVLARLNIQAVCVEGKGCCGALNHHLGQSQAAHRYASALVADIALHEKAQPFSAIATTASGCGSVIRDYGFQLGNEHAGQVGARTVDIMELISGTKLPPAVVPSGTRIVFHTPCSLQHGMKQSKAGPSVLRQLGFEVIEPRDTACCGSAGVYNVLEPTIARELQMRKVASLLALKPQFIATGNIGCLAQIAAQANVGVVHPIQLVDWALGGAKPSPSS